jgi:hypothetical protein
MTYFSEVLSANECFLSTKIRDFFWLLFITKYIKKKAFINIMKKKQISTYQMIPKKRVTTIALVDNQQY